MELDELYCLDDTHPPANRRSECDASKHHASEHGLCTVVLALNLQIFNSLGIVTHPERQLCTQGCRENLNEIMHEVCTIPSAIASADPHLFPCAVP